MVSRSVRGRLVGRSCRKATSAQKRRKACTRTLTEGTLRRKAQTPGRRSLDVSGRFGRRHLAPGRYALATTATGAGGRSKRVTVSFTILQP